jgi:hypothetical protein
MVAAGELRAHMETRAQGARLRVLWDTDREPPKLNAGQEQAETPGNTAIPGDELTWLRARVEAAERERDELRQLLAMALRALPPPRVMDASNDAPGRTMDASNGASPAHSEAPPPSEKRRRWWHALVWG